MKFLADMGLSVGTVEYLRSQGYDAVHLREQGLHKMKDSDILQKSPFRAAPLSCLNKCWLSFISNKEDIQQPGPTQAPFFRCFLRSTLLRFTRRGLIILETLVGYYLLGGGKS